MKLRRHGNSLVVTVPRQVVKILKWGEGTELEVVREQDHLLVRRFGDDF